MSPPTKILLGIYNTCIEASKRQIEFCGKDFTYGFKKSIVSGNGWITFINTFPKGGSYTELFTTGPTEEEMKYICEE